MFQKPNWLLDYDYDLFLHFCTKYEIDLELYTYEEAVEKILISVEIAMEMRNI